MFSTINDAFNEYRRKERVEAFIAEAAMDVEEVMPESDDDLDDTVDSDSVPDEVYKKIDSALDAIVNDPNFDDTEIEELVDDDIDDDSEDLNVIIDEAMSAYWYDDENIHHPNTKRRDGTEHQPLYHVEDEEWLDDDL